MDAPRSSTQSVPESATENIPCRRHDKLAYPSPGAFGTPLQARQDRSAHAMSLLARARPAPAGAYRRLATSSWPAAPRAIRLSLRAASLRVGRYGSAPISVPSRAHQPDSPQYRSPAHDRDWPPPAGMLQDLPPEDASVSRGLFE